jgi:hypothetical protein
VAACPNLRYGVPERHWVTVDTHVDNDSLTSIRLMPVDDGFGRWIW